MMNDNSFDPARPYRYAVYLRMSSDLQNEKSPDTQQMEIDATLARLGYPWIRTKVYRDDAVSGRKLRARVQFMQMLQDIQTGVLQVDLILIDMLERFSRGEELEGLRRNLRNRHGVLVLTADSRFADPTSVSGQALAIVDTIRSTQTAREKAHTVRRGKRFAASQKKWPGGPPPLGYRLESVMKPGDGPSEVDYRRLVVDPATAPIVREAFELAHDKGWGGVRLWRGTSMPGPSSWPSAGPSAPTASIACWPTRSTRACCSGDG